MTGIAVLRYVKFLLLAATFLLVGCGGDVLTDSSVGQSGPSQDTDDSVRWSQDIAFAEQLLQQHPGNVAEILGKSQASAFSDNALFALVMENGVHVVYMGGEDRFEGMRLYSEDGHFLVGYTIDTQNRVFESTLCTGDRLILTEQDGGIRLTCVLAGTTPESIVVLDISEDGQPIYNEVASSIALEGNPLYGELYEPAMSGESSASKASFEMPDCDTILNAIDTAFKFACGVDSMIGDVAHVGLAAVCGALDTLLDNLASRYDLPPRFVASLGFALTKTCAGLDIAIDGGELITDGNAFGIACLVYDLADDLFIVSAGDSVSNVLCDAFEDIVEEEVVVVEEEVVVAEMEECFADQVAIDDAMCGCQDGSEPGPDGFCDCPAGAIRNPITLECECEDHSFADAQTLRCECETGYVDIVGVALASEDEYEDPNSCISCPDAQSEFESANNDYQAKQDLLVESGARVAACSAQCLASGGGLNCADMHNGPCSERYDTLQQQNAALSEDLANLNELITRMEAAGCASVPSLADVVSPGGV